MIFYDHDSGESLSLEELCKRLVDAKHLITTEVKMAREVTTSTTRKPYYLIDSTNTAYKIEPNKYTVYE
jgi:hypothetical protein